MKVSCVYWDAEKKQFEYLDHAVDANDMVPNSNDGVKYNYFHVTREIDRFNHQEEMKYAAEIRDKYNQQLTVPADNTDEDSILVCKECGDPFYLDTRGKWWYLDKGFKMPCRCENCRKKRREGKKDA